MESTTVVIQFSGYSNSGKTTLLSKVIRFLSAKGLRVAVIKHDGGHDFQLDQEGKDTWTYQEAGASLIAIQSNIKSVWFDYSQVSLAQMISRMETAKPDIILVEGYKQERYPKVVVIRQAEEKELIDQVHNPIALVGWIPLEHRSLPVFDVQDDQKISQFVFDYFQRVRSER